MGSEALELALAVYRTPIKRHALYDMALPHDIGLVLQLASAPQPLLSEVAAEVDESEDTIIEASRFYLQLALFQPDADAYRVLGLADNAPRERVREHYRWLQRWLHPDRRGEDWEALFATRVNWAWSNLRNEAARRAYDIECDHGTPTHPDASAALEGRRAAEWNPFLAHGNRTNRAGQIVIGALVCSCIALLYMALMRGDGVPQDEIGIRSNQTASESAGTAMPDPSRLAAPHDIEHIAPASASGAAPAESKDVAQMPPLPKAISDRLREMDDGASAQQSGESIAAIRKPKIADEPKAAADTSSKNPIDHDNSSAPIKSGTAGPAASTAVVAEKESNSRSPSVLAASTATVAHATAPAHGESDGKNQDATRDGGNGAGSTDDALARIGMAHQRVKELSTFFSKFDSRLPPIWNDLAGQASAEAQRSALHERAGLRDPGDFVVDDARWRMSENSAALSANYHLLKRNAVSESGRLSLSMVWRERMWLVTQVELRPTL